jgi:hypothetical protein
MTEESPAKRGDAAWAEERDAVARRNAEAHKRAQAQKRTRESMAAKSARADMDREAQQLHDLNTRISKQQARGVR